MAPLNGYTKNQIKKAGNNLVNNTDIEQSMEVLSHWRAKHSRPLEAAFDILKTYVDKVDTSGDKDSSPMIAKRLKRTESIINKLNRYEGMQLTRINDIGGCRAVLSSDKKVQKLTRLLTKDGHFELRRDYIKEPKDSGYRSIHLIGMFEDEDGAIKPVELQIRTRIQHSWATALEIVDLYTRQSIKTNAGSKDWTDFFIHVSTIFALLEENPYIRSSNRKMMAMEFLRMIKEKDCDKINYSLYKVHQLREKLKTMERFDAFSSSVTITSDHIRQASIDGYVLISIQRNKEEFEIQSRIFRRIESKEANAAYLELEKKAIGKDSNLVVALVSTTALGGIQEAYPNYFADAKAFLEFLSLLDFAYKQLNPPMMRAFKHMKHSIEDFRFKKDDVKQED